MKKFKGKLAALLVTAMVTCTLNPAISVLAESESGTGVIVATSSNASKSSKHNKKSNSIASSSDALWDDDDDEDTETEEDDLEEVELINDLEEELEDAEEVFEEATPSDAEEYEDAEELLENDTKAIVTATLNEKTAFYFEKDFEEYKIRLSADAGVLPQNVEVCIEKIKVMDGFDISELVQKELSEETRLQSVVAFDITFLLDGEEIQPEGSVEVKIEQKNPKENDLGLSTKVFHIEQASEIEEMNFEVDENDTISIMADSFSVYAVALTAEEYIPIYTVEDLRNMDINVASNTEFRLMNDLDLSGIQWEPLKLTRNKTVTQCVIDGGGHTIYNLQIDKTIVGPGSGKDFINIDDEYVGLFNLYGNICIQNLTISGANINVTIDDTVHAGSSLYVGTLYGSPSDNRYITNVHVLDSSIVVNDNSSGYGYIYVGGVGSMAKDMEDVSFAGSMDITLKHAGGNIGGIAGAAFGRTITNCVNYANINVKTEPYSKDTNVGGITGSRNVIINGCCNFGNISYKGRLGSVGGIIGSLRAISVNSNDTIVQNCYNVGKIECEKNQVLSLSSGVGGLVGAAESVGTVYSCYNVGDIIYSDVETDQISSSYNEVTGSLVGISRSGKSSSWLDSCYYIFGTQAIGTVYDDEALVGDTRKISLSQLEQQTNLSWLDFDSTWKMGDSNYPYPILQWQDSEDLPDVEIESEEPVDSDESLYITDISILNGDVYTDSDIVLKFNKPINELPDFENGNFQIKEYLGDDIFFEWASDYTEYVIEENTLTMKNALTDCAIGQLYYLYIPDGFFSARDVEGEVYHGCNDRTLYNFTVQAEGLKIVKFVYNINSEQMIKLVRLKVGDICPIPEDPVWDGYEFVGWYITENFNELGKFDFATKIRDNITLYGKFEVATNKNVTIGSVANSQSGVSGGQSDGDDSPYDVSVKDSGFTSTAIINGETVWMVYQNGKPLTGYQEELYYNGQQGAFLFDENGIMLTGWHNVNGQLKYFDETTGHRGFEITPSSVAQKLKDKSAYELLGSYDYASVFSTDLNVFDATNFLIVNYDEVNELVKKWLITQEDQVTVNEDWAKEYLKKVVNSLCGTESIPKFFSINESEQSFSREGSKVLVSLVKQTEYSSVAEMYEYLKKATDLSEEALDGMFANYTSNICMLEQYAEICPQLRSVIDELMNEYTHSVSLNLKKAAVDKLADELNIKNVNKTYQAIYKEWAGNGSAGKTDVLNGYVASDKALESMVTKLFVKTLQENVNDLSSVSDVETVIYSAYTRTQVIQALKDAENNLKNNPNSYTAQNEYIVAFDIAQEATKIQYWAMYEYYNKRGEAEKAAKVYENYKQLDSMNFYNY